MKYKVCVRKFVYLKRIMANLKVADLRMNTKESESPDISNIIRDFSG